MIRLDGFAQAVSGFLKSEWSTAVPSLQAVFNRASSAFASLDGSPAMLFTHLHNPRTMAITSVTLVVLLAVKKWTGSKVLSDTVVLNKGYGFKELLIIQEDAKTLTYDTFIAKHGKKVIDILDEPTKSLLCRPVISTVKEVSDEAVVLAQPVTLSDQANALALHLKEINGDFDVFSEFFDRTKLTYVTNHEAKKYILKIVGDAVRNKTITYPQIRPYLDLGSIAKMDPNTEEMQQLRYLFLSFEGRVADLYEEDRRVFKSETNIYVLWFKSIKASRSRFTAGSRSRGQF